MSQRRLERQRAAPRRRPVANNPMARSRPDRVAAWALLLGIFLILLAATTSRGETGGSQAPAAPPATGPAAGAPAAELGERVLQQGSEGADVRTLQAILRARDYGDLKLTGAFDAATADAVKRFQREAGLTVDGIVGPQTRPALLALMRYRRATWYGPGLYGNRTACGKRLRRATLGVAHKRLPCGTRVTFYRGGHFVTLPVIDRGPFRHGVAWDLTAAAARKLGMASSTRLRSTH
ncbi:MAG TPA: peptidoglycan-binding protein [Solirubrobacterales bacterium]|nr:peptidoglycan-binding protein [Solirubrobacterales bacterium]